jgi:hypothetical protein
LQACIPAERLHRFIQISHDLFFLHRSRRCTRASCCSLHGSRRERKSRLPPSISYKSPLSPPSPRAAPSISNSYKSLGTCTVRKKSASQPNMQKKTSIRQSYTIPYIPIRLVPFLARRNDLTCRPHPSAHASSTVCWSCSTPPCTSPCSWCSRSIRPRRERSRAWGCSGRSSVR